MTFCGRGRLGSDLVLSRFFEGERQATLISLPERWLIVLAGAAVMLSGCPEGCTPRASRQPCPKSCTADSDCECGIDRGTRDCAFGRKECIDPTQQCPDFCTGMGGQLDVACVAGECRHVRRVRKDQGNSASR